MDITSSNEPVYIIYYISLDELICELSISIYIPYKGHI